MEQVIISIEPILRLSVFLGLLALFACSERIWPHRKRVATSVTRWRNNFTLMISGALLTRFAIPAGAVGAAFWAQASGFGLLNWLDVPHWLAILMAIVALDFAIYVQHLAMHNVPILWRLHRIHHTDVDLDVSSGVRFHPVEIMLSMAYKVCLVILLGAPAVAVIVFEVILNACSMFQHSNTHFPERFDKSVRNVLVTPHLHRVHHSPTEYETNSNYGFSTSIWDRVCGTYRDRPEQDSRTMDLGVQDATKDQASSLLYLLARPFK